MPNLVADLLSEKGEFVKILLVSNKVKTYSLLYQITLSQLISLGHEVVWAADFSKFIGDTACIPCKTVQISINSNPLKPCNIGALRALLQIIEEENIEAVQCNTPIGGMLGRLAAKRKGVPLVIYAAHGFLFFKGAPLLNRTVYKLQEQLMAHWTDVLITITDEDHQAAQSFKLRSGKAPYLVHGAGVEVGKKVSVDRAEKRRELGVPENAFVMVSAGFLNKNKNNRVLIEALGKLKNPDIYYLVCGEGEERARLQELAKQAGVEDNVLFLGYRTDMDEILASADLFAMPSFREGVPRALLEAMDLGMTCIGSCTRGITELLSNGDGGILCGPSDADAYAKGIKKLYTEPQLRQQMGELNRETAKAYSKERVQEELLAIYTEVLGNKNGG